MLSRFCSVARGIIDRVHPMAHSIRAASAIVVPSSCSLAPPLGSAVFAAGNLLQRLTLPLAAPLLEFPFVLWLKRTYQPSVQSKKRTHGFLRRLEDHNGRNVLKRRILKGRTRKSRNRAMLSSADPYITCRVIPVPQAEPPSPSAALWAVLVRDLSLRAAERDSNAVKLQKTFRMLLARRRYRLAISEKRLLDLRAEAIQCAYRCHRSRCLLDSLRTDRLAQMMQEDTLSRERERHDRRKRKPSPRDEETKQYFRPGLESPSHKLRVRAQPTSKYVTDICKRPKTLIYKVKYTEKEPFTGVRENREWDLWGMRQKGFTLKPDGSFERTKYFKTIFDPLPPPPPVSLSPEDIPPPKHRRDFASSYSLPDLKSSYSDDLSMVSPGVSCISQKRSESSFVAYEGDQILESKPSVTNNYHNRDRHYHMVQSLPFLAGISKRPKPNDVVSAKQLSVRRRIEKSFESRRQVDEAYKDQSMKKFQIDCKLIRSLSNKQKLIASHVTSLSEYLKLTEGRVQERWRNLERRRRETESPSPIASTASVACPRSSTSPVNSPLLRSLAASASQEIDAFESTLGGAAPQ